MHGIHDDGLKATGAETAKSAELGRRLRSFASQAPKLKRRECVLFWPGAARWPLEMSQDEVTPVVLVVRRASSRPSMTARGRPLQGRSGQSLGAMPRE
jgi:hypothetical protein